MKIGVYGDLHYCSNSSLVRSRGDFYSTRLENCINTINWAEKFFSDSGCEMVVCLGDFFDKPTLNAEELTAFNRIYYSNVRHFMLVGNHEITRSDRKFSSMHVFEQLGFNVVSDPLIVAVGNKDLVFLPYIVEEDRKPLSNYLSPNGSNHNIIFSHNDIKGIQMGAFKSVEGFDVQDIKDHCDLFINGHLHNGGFVDEEEKILNLGNLTGQNFGEDAFNYSHFVCIVDTETNQLTFQENPCALNFYKIDATENKPVLENLKPNSVVSLKCLETDMSFYRDHLNSLENIIEYRLTTTRGESQMSNDEMIFNSVDHLDLFNKFILNKLGDTLIVKEELSKLLEGN